MNVLGGYFVDNINDCICNVDNIIQGQKYRFSILTERLIRIEYSEDGFFEDRPTQRIIFRNFPKVNYKVEQSDKQIQISTSYFTLNYLKEKFFLGGKFSPESILSIKLNGTDRVWFYGNPDYRNYGSVSYSLDDFDGKLKLENSLFSSNGFSAIDDSNSFVLNEQRLFVNKERKHVDIYVFMYRKDFGLVLKDYFKLTGYPLMIPRYALGNLWFKDKKYTTNDLKRLVNNFSLNEIPLSAILLGHKWHNDNDPISFDLSILNPGDVKQILNARNMYLGVTINPKLKVKKGSISYQNMQSYYDGNGDISFLPVDDKKVTMYSKFLVEGLLNSGVDFFNVDYDNAKDKRSLALFNHYHFATNAMQYNKRGFCLVRDHNMAIHRMGVIYSGRTIVDWHTLSILPKYNSSASNMGISFVANSIGGFHLGIEDSELYIRYIQFGTFSPMMVLSCDESEFYIREPWRLKLPEMIVARKYLNLRNKLVPYLYTASYLYATNGIPIVQPLYYNYPAIYDEPLYTNEYFFGSSILVCPITKKKNVILNRVVHKVFIPKGVWYDFETGKKYIGNKYYVNFYRDEDYPVFCREGSIIVMSLDKDTTNPVNLEISVYPGKNNRYQLYEDDGITNNYKNGYYAVTNFSFKSSSDRYELDISSSGKVDLLPSVRNYRFVFKNTRLCDVTVTNGENKIDFKSYDFKNHLIVEVSNVLSTFDLKVICSGKSLENIDLKLINKELEELLDDMEIETLLKEKVDSILFSDLSIRKKRIEIRKLRRRGLSNKYIRIFINLLEYIDTIV